MNICTVDIETELIPKDGILAIEKLYCAGIKSGDTPTKCYTSLYTSNSDGHLSNLISAINTHDFIVMHNGIKFDKPVIENLLDIITAKPIDTLIDAKLMYSQDVLYEIDYQISTMPKELYGKYSLEAFGHRLDDHKIQYEDFSQLSTDMVTYCKQDIDLTYKLYIFLSSQPNYPKEHVRQLEYDIAAIISKQEHYGFPFDIKAARDLSMKLQLEQLNIKTAILKVFRPKFLPDQPVQHRETPLIRTIYLPTKHYKFKSRPPYRNIHQLKRQKNGKWKFPAKTKFKWFSEPHRDVKVTTQGHYQPVKLTAFNPGSRAHITRWLKDLYNWEPTVFTESGIPKINYDVLASLPYDEAQPLKRYLKLVKDLSQLSGTDNSLIGQYNENSGCIHGRVDTLGANTHRATHSKPNLAQIPADGLFRPLFSAPEGYSLVGADLKNIEVRMLAHYLYPFDQGKYIEAVLSKDMHWYHCKLAGFWDGPEEWDDNHTPEMKAARNRAKTFFFGWLYGQGNMVRGYNLWHDGAVIDYTDEEYETALATVQRTIEQRGITVNDNTFIPIKDGFYVQYNDMLILQTIYGKRVSDEFLERVDGMKALISACKQAANTGFIEAIDGRYLPVRSAHSALNLLLQGSAGIVAKKWCINFHNLAAPQLAYGTDWWQCAFVHDEFQSVCLHDKAETLAHIKVQGCDLIQQQFNTNLPIEADANIGKTWADTH